MKKGDLILIVIIVLIASAALVGKFIIGQAADETRLVITRDQVVLYDEILTDSSNDVIKIEDHDEYNIITITNGIVTISEANCFNQICVNDGNIDKAGEIIVCLPHKVTVEIKGEKTTIIDAVSE